MKNLVLIIFTIGIVQVAFSCSCSPWNDNFYENVSVNNQIGFIRLDSTYVDTTTALPTPMALFSLILNRSIADKNDGDTLLLYGQDGLNCMIGFSQFNIGDTLVAALSEGPENLYSIPFWGSGCGVHYLKITNGQHDGLDFNEILDKIEDFNVSILVSNKIEGISIKANPIKSDRILLSNSLPLNSRIIVINNLGQKFIDLQVKTVTNSIDVSMLPKGMYQLRLSHNHSSISKKVVLL
jgi:hypothetical protein